MTTPRPVPLEGVAPRLLAASGDDLVVIDRESASTLVLAATRWPPRRVPLKVSTVLATRSADGDWRLLVNEVKKGRRLWTLRRLAAGQRRVERGEDIAFGGGFFGIESSETGAASDADTLCPVETMTDLGGDTVLLYRPRDGVARRPLWHPDAGGIERSLPAMSADVTPLLRTVRLGDGADVLLWDGRAHERVGGSFERTFDAHLDVATDRPWQPVASGPDGFFYLSARGELIAVRRGRLPPQIHLPGLSLDSLGPGPGGSLVVRTRRHVLLYRPLDGSLLALDPGLCGEHVSAVHWATVGLVILRETTPPVLDLYPAALVAKIPPRPAGDVIDELEGRTVVSAGPTGESCPRVAAHGRHIAMVSGRQLRGFLEDAPLWRQTTSPVELVGVVTHPDGFAVLDARGVLRVHRASDGAVVRETPVTGSPRTLAASTDGRVAVLSAAGVFVVEPARTARVPVEGATAAAFDADGSLLVAGSAGSLRLLSWSGTSLHERDLPSLPGPAGALAAQSGGAWLALVGGELRRLDPGASDWTVVPGETDVQRLVGSPDGAGHALQKRSTMVTVTHPGSSLASTSIAYPDTYSAPTQEALAVDGMAFVGPDDLVVALRGGRGNLCQARGTLKLDPFAGERSAHWVFVRDGDILVA